MRITVRPDQTITVTVPKRMSLREAHLFAEEKRSWIKNTLLALEKRTKDSITIPKPKRKDFIEHKDRAYTLVEERLQHFNDFYQLTWNSISIKSMKTRWGSCSKRGNLNFSYRIVFLPPELADYLVVHELCHLKEFNHSSKFWETVEKSIPNYKLLRKQLKAII